MVAAPLSNLFQVKRKIFLDSPSVAPAFFKSSSNRPELSPLYQKVYCYVALPTCECAMCHVLCHICAQHPLLAELQPLVLRLLGTSGTFETLPGSSLPPTSSIFCQDVDPVVYDKKCRQVHRQLHGHILYQGACYRTGLTTLPNISAHFQSTAHIKHILLHVHR